MDILLFNILDAVSLAIDQPLQLTKLLLNDGYQGQFPVAAHADNAPLKFCQDYARVQRAWPKSTGFVKAGQRVQFRHPLSIRHAERKR
jgi:hypothetical protein